MVLLFISNLLFSQVAINTDGSSADASAMLDIKSTSRGLLIPRMTASERDNISSPATGLMVYVIDDNSFWYYDGTNWVQVGAGVPDNDWTINGNNIYSAVSGNVGIGTNNPQAKLHILKSTSGSAQFRIDVMVNTYGPTGAGFYVNNYGDLEISAERTTNVMEFRNISLAVGGGNVGIGTNSPDAKLTVITNGYYNQFSLVNSQFYSGGWARGGVLNTAV